jgi:hypothetical protein
MTAFPITEIEPTIVTLIAPVIRIIRDREILTVLPAIIPAMIATIVVIVTTTAFLIIETHTRIIRARRIIRIVALHVLIIPIATTTASRTIGTELTIATPIVGLIRVHFHDLIATVIQTAKPARIVGRRMT